MSGRVVVGFSGGVTSAWAAGWALRELQARGFGAASIAQIQACRYALEQINAPDASPPSTPGEPAALDEQSKEPR